MAYLVQYGDSGAVALDNDGNEVKYSEVFNSDSLSGGYDVPEFKSVADLADLFKRQGVSDYNIIEVDDFRQVKTFRGQLCNRDKYEEWGYDG